MPLEMDAIVKAFALSPASKDKGAPWTGRVWGSDVTCVHIGMGPPATRAALNRLFAAAEARGPAIDHVMIAGICGGLHPDLPVGTLINPEVVIDHSSGAAYLHHPPHDEPRAGKLVTTERVMFDAELSRSFFEDDGCFAVDMETSAVGEVCKARDTPWSVYRCIGDRHFDDLLDERLVAMSNPDGSANIAEVQKLLAAEPDIVGRLEQLAQDSALAARLAAEAAVRGCRALDGAG
jgi:adenosylhomocysteine nucleosidase